jgi:hypothetical protein
VGRVVHRVEIEGQRERRLRERGDELIHEQFAEPKQGLDVDVVSAALWNGARIAGWAGPWRADSIARLARIERLSVLSREGRAFQQG